MPRLQQIQLVPVNVFLSRSILMTCITKHTSFSMEDGQEVVAKVPNPNAGIPHFTAASEVATMNFGSLS